MKSNTKKMYENAARRISSSMPQYAEWQLQLVVDRLNISSARIPTQDPQTNEFNGWQQVDTSEAQKELQLLVGRWIAAERNFATILDENPDLDEICANGRMRLLPDLDGNVQMAFLPHILKSAPDGRRAALYLFVNFLVNPLASKLNGPCGRCGSFYLSTSAHKRVYCGRKCSSAATSQTKHIEQRAAQRAKKLRLAQRSVLRFERAHTTKVWKYWVSRDTRISKKWLTQAVNSWELAPPKKTQPKSHT